jgi:hypothetical protein
VAVSTTNGLAFDPVRPAAGVTGTLRISLHDGNSSAPALDELLVDGALEAFPPGTTRVDYLEFSGEIQGPFVVAAEVDSPAGDPVVIDTEEKVQLLATVETLEATAAQVDVSGREVTVKDVDLELEDVDEEVVDRILSGAFDLDIRNPWSIGASFNLAIHTPSGLILKSFNVPPAPTSTARVEFDQDELRRILGQPGVVMRGFGTVDPEAGVREVTPGQVLTVETTLDLVIRVGGEEG